MNWTFGTQELISLIAAIGTLAAVSLSLIFSLKSKSIKFKVRIKGTNKLKPVMHIVNSGDIKFAITAFGIRIDNDYYISNKPIFTKALGHKIIDKPSIILPQIPLVETMTQTEKFNNFIVCDPGDIVKVSLDSFNSDLIKKAKNVKLFIVVRFKLYEYSFEVKSDVEDDKDRNTDNYRKCSREEILFD